MDRTIVGGVREALVVRLRGRGKTVCARVARPGLLCGPSTSPLEAAARNDREMAESDLRRPRGKSQSGADARPVNFTVRRQCFESP